MDLVSDRLVEVDQPGDLVSPPSGKPAKPKPARPAIKHKSRNVRGYIRAVLQQKALEQVLVEREEKLLGKLKRRVRKATATTTIKRAALNGGQIRAAEQILKSLGIE